MIIFLTPLYFLILHTDHRVLHSTHYFLCSILTYPLIQAMPQLYFSFLIFFFVFATLQTRIFIFGRVVSVFINPATISRNATEHSEQRSFESTDSGVDLKNMLPFHFILKLFNSVFSNPFSSKKEGKLNPSEL